MTIDDEALAAVLAELGRAANALSTARYLLADPATAVAATADSRLQVLRQVLADHLTALGQEPGR